MIISDASPLIALAVIDKLDLPEKLYDEVLVPQAVYREATQEGKPYADKIDAWAKNKIVGITDLRLFEKLKNSLHEGEAEAITLYKEKSADVLLIDERMGRKVAAKYGVNIIGTLGMLLEAKKKGIIPAIKPLIDILQNTDIRISDNIYRLSLKAAGE